MPTPLRTVRSFGKALLASTFLATAAYAERVTESADIAGRATTLNGGGFTGESRSLVVGDDILVTNVGQIRGRNLDLLIEVTSISGNVVYNQARGVFTIVNYSPTDQDYIRFDLSFFRTGTTTPVSLDELNATLFDLDSTAGRNFTEVGGVLSPQSSSRGSNLETGGFITPLQAAAGFDLARLIPDNTGPTPDWTSRVNSNPVDAPAASATYRLGATSTASILFGVTGAEPRIGGGRRGFSLSGLSLVVRVPDAVNDEDLNNTPLGSPVTVSNITGNDTIEAGADPIDASTVQLLDPNNGNAEVTTLTVANEGTWTVNTTGTGATSTADVTFTPLPSFSGTPTPVQYVVSDTAGGTSSPGSITVTYAGGGPAAANDEDLNNARGSNVTIDVVGNDSTGAAGRTLDPTSVRLLDPNNGNNPVTTLTVAGQGTWSVDATTGQVTFDPVDGFLGDPTPVEYTVADNQGDISNPATITVTYVDARPVAADDESRDNVPGTDVSINVLANDLPDGTLDPATLTLVNATGNAVENPLVVPGEGTWTIDRTAGTITFSPEDGFTGDPTPVRYVVSDGSTFSTPATITITYASDEEEEEGIVPPEVVETVTAILEDDLQVTVDRQSALFGDIARGARDRLDALRCVADLNAIVASNPILFDTDSAVIKPQSAGALNEIAAVLGRCDAGPIEIGGHTDSRASDAYNLDLSQRRVESVRRALAARGVDAGTLVARGYGESRPIADNATAEGRARNRRVEFRQLDGADALAGCGDGTPFDVDGDVRLGSGGLVAAGLFGGEDVNCRTGVRTIVRGDFSVTQDDDLGTQAMLNGTYQRERLVGPNHLRGFFAGGYLSRTSVDQRGADGEIDGIGLNAGVYGAARVREDLILDYYAAGAVGRHDFDLRFAETEAGEISTDGSYDYVGVFGGLALSGEATYRDVLLTPRAGVQLSYATASDADATFELPTISQDLELDIEDQGRLRLFAELGFTLGGDHGEGGLLSEGDGVGRLHLAPRVFCDVRFGDDDDTECGLGAAFEYAIEDLTRGVSYGLDLDVEATEDVRRGAVGVFYERTLFQDAGVARLGADLDGDGNASLLGEVEVEF